MRTALIGVLVNLALAWQPATAQTGITPGRPQLKPGTQGPFFRDPHQGGDADELLLQELVWGRLVDVLGLDENGSIDPEPVFRDFLVGNSIQSDGANFLLVPS